MKPCPHCGADIRENARFCPHCMTVLNQKQVIPNARYISLRWLPIAAAFWALVVALQWLPQTAKPPILSDSGISSGAVISTSASTSASPTEEGVPTVTEGTDPIGDVPGTTVGGRPGNIHIYQPGANEDTTTDPYDWDVGKGTTHNTGTTSRTTSKKDTSTTTTTKSTTTTTTTTRATSAVPTYPAVWDEQAVYYTEDGQAFEEVEWTYKPYWSDKFTYSPIIALTYTITKTCRYNLPLSGCIVVTGFDAPTANGYYRIPPVIDGKVVLGVDMSADVSGACQFNDAAIAPTVKYITFPTEMLFLNRSTIDQCTNLERLYFDCDKLYMDPKALPQCNSNTYVKDLLRLYGRPDILYDNDPYTSSWLPNYCEYIKDKYSGATTRGSRVRYYNVCHYDTDDLHYWTQLYPT